MKKILIMIVLPALLSASKCGPNKIEVFYPAHVENDKKLSAETKCMTRKDWKAQSKNIDQNLTQSKKKPI